MSYDLALIGGDIHFALDGNPMVVIDKDKLAQDIAKILLTRKGSDLGSVQYGSVLQSNLGQPFDFNILQSLIAKSVSEALTFLQSLELVQGTKQTLSFQEVIGSVDAVSVTQPTFGQIDVQIAITTVQGLRSIFAIRLSQQ
jgi:hypothetical protein